MTKAKTAIKEVSFMEWSTMQKDEEVIPHQMYHGFEISKLPLEGTAKIFDKLNKDGFVIYEFDDGESKILAYWLEEQLSAVGVEVVRPPQNPYSLWIVSDEKKFHIDLR